MMKWLKQIDEFLAHGERILVVCLYSTLIGLIVFNITTRNFFHLSFHRILEIAPAFVLWLALLGATIGLKQNRHIRLELFLRFCPLKTRRIAARTVCVFGLMVMGALFCAALQFTANEIKIFGPWGASAIIFPLFFALAAFRFLVRLMEPAPDIEPLPSAGLPPSSADGQMPP